MPASARFVGATEHSQLPILEGRCDSWKHVPGTLNRYQLGRKTADFLLCRDWGVYLGAVMRSERGSFGIINVRVLTSLLDRLQEPECMNYRRKNRFSISGDVHIQYFNRHFGLVLRPSRVSAMHEPYSPGLHHLYLRVNSESDVHSVANQLRALGVGATEARRYPEYADDYTATFFESPDGIRLEVTNYREERRERHDCWHRGVG